MKIRIGMKCPDVLDMAIQEAAENEIMGPADSEEHDEAFDDLVKKSKRIAERWFKYGEFINVVIDTDTETCVIEPA